MKRKSNIVLLLGIIVLALGAVLSVCEVEPYANYVLIAGAALIIIRGAMRMREKDEPLPPTDAPQSSSDESHND